MTPEEIRAIRKSISLTQTEWRFWLGCSRSLVVKMENGTRAVPPGIALLAQAYRDGWRPAAGDDWRPAPATPSAEPAPMSLRERIALGVARKRSTGQITDAEWTRAVDAYHRTEQRMPGYVVGLVQDALSDADAVIAVIDAAGTGGDNG